MTPQANIAGMHSVLSRKVTNPLYNFAGSKWFQDETVFGDPSYVTTAYFVDPELHLWKRPDPTRRGEGWAQEIGSGFTLVKKL